MLNESIFNIYLIFPFLFSLIFGVLIFIKNPIVIRAIAKIFYIINFTFISTIVLFSLNSELSVANISFYLNKTNNIHSFLLSLIFLLLIFFSKTKIRKLHRIFYPISILLLGICNLFIYSDNIYVILIGLFWVFLIQYLLKSLYIKKETTIFKNELIYNLVILFITFALIAWDFLRYFIINNTEFTFTSINANLVNISDTSILLVFIGFNLIIARLFNLIPFSTNQNCEISKTNSFIFIFNFILSIFFGLILILKIYPCFNYLYFDFQKFFIIYLMVNFFYYIFISQRNDNAFRIIHNVFSSLNIFMMFEIFSFSENNINQYNSCMIMLLFLFLLINLVFLNIENKIKSLDFEIIKKNMPKNRLVQFLLIISIFIFTPLPFINTFLPITSALLDIFTVQYKTELLNLLIYLLPFGLFLIAAVNYNLIYKLLIEPDNKNEVMLFSYHQKIVYTILIFTILLLGFFGNTLFI